MFKKYLFLAAGLFFLLLNPKPVHADDSFAVDATVSYKVEETGKTLVTHDIVLENLFSTLYATTYTLSLENISAQNVHAADDSGKPVKVDTTQDGEKLNIKLIFNDAVVGRSARRHFSISYENSGFATKTGEVWEISIPRLAEQASFRNYHVNLLVPDSFGQEAYISPQPIADSDSGGFKTYSFSKENISATGVTAGFGQFQVFAFTLSYHLENPLAVNSQTQIALPPDTAFQKVYFNKIEPKPIDVQIDEDGNWLAIYKLSPRQRVDVNINGSVQIFASFRPFPKPPPAVLGNDLLPTTYWQADNPRIKLLAEDLKTPEAIYNYVSKNLKYNVSRVQPNVQRMGALGALQSPTQAICMEFTDLFIALSRAAGIPAREINGFAYTENPELQPLSLVNDVLHAWPEYYDKTKGAWIPVDPTWGSTSGVDYFNKLDLRHFAFVIHGKNSTQPYPPGSYKLGANPQKDVFVSFGQLPSQRNSIPEISMTMLRSIPFLDTLYNLKVYNPGPVSLDSVYPTVYFDSIQHSRDFIQVLPPYSSYQSQIKIPFDLLGKGTPDSIKVAVNESRLSLPTNKAQLLTNSLLIIFIFLIMIIIAVMVRLKKLSFIKISDKMAGIYAKVTGKSAKNKNSP
jgi:transglutaminase-like putative cysteine protease